MDDYEYFTSTVTEHLMGSEYEHGPWCHSFAQVVPESTIARVTTDLETRGFTIVNIFTCDNKTVIRFYVAGPYVPVTDPIETMNWDTLTAAKVRHYNKKRNDSELENLKRDTGSKRRMMEIAFSKLGF